VHKAYKERDVQLIGDKDGIIHGPEWHAEHMNRLTSFIIKMADSCNDVRDWLTLNRPNEYQPTDLLSNCLTSEPTEESKEETVEKVAEINAS